LVAVNFQQRKADAERVARIRNLQQWGIALNIYLIENDSQLPAVGATPVSENQTKAWYNALPPGISEEPLASLPPGKRPRPGEPSLWIRPGLRSPKVWDPEVFYFSYGMNRFLQPVEGVRSFRIYEIEYPGSVVFLAPIDDFVPVSDPENVAFPGGRNGRTPAPVLFCDGHVEMVSPSVLTSEQSRTAAAAAEGPSWYEK